MSNNFSQKSLKEVKIRATQINKKIRFLRKKTIENIAIHRCNQRKISLRNMKNNKSPKQLYVKIKNFNKEMNYKKICPMIT